MEWRKLACAFYEIIQPIAAGLVFEGGSLENVSKLLWSGPSALILIYCFIPGALPLV
jgi:hypothetical protein